MTPMRISLEALTAQKNFALLAPGYRGTTAWTLIRNLRRAEPHESRLVVASYEGAPQYFSGQESDVQFELGPVSKLEVSLDDSKVAEAVSRIRESIAAGDVYQVNYTLRAQVTCDSAVTLLTALCRRSVPRFAAWFNIDGVGECVSASPEMLFEVEGRTIRAEPMKGTARPEDRELLLASEKDRAELAMITDMLRDDLNHVCEAHSVKVANARRVIELPYVLQTVSDVEGTLRSEMSVQQIIQQLHPGASITGAPRKSAMTHIASLEDQPRGLYCGLLGLVSPMQTRAALLIRTATRSSETSWVYGVGAGITWNSESSSEIEEIRMKLGALK